MAMYRHSLHKIHVFFFLLHNKYSVFKVFMIILGKINTFFFSVDGI